MYHEAVKLITFPGGYKNFTWFVAMYTDSFEHDISSLEIHLLSTSQRCQEPSSVIDLSFNFVLKIGGNILL